MQGEKYKIPFHQHPMFTSSSLHNPIVKAFPDRVFLQCCFPISKPNAPKFDVAPMQAILHSNQFCQMLWTDPCWWSNVVHPSPASKRCQKIMFDFLFLLDTIFVFRLPSRNSLWHACEHEVSKEFTHQIDSPYVTNPTVTLPRSWLEAKKWCTNNMSTQVFGRLLRSIVAVAWKCSSLERMRELFRTIHGLITVYRLIETGLGIC